MAGHSKWANIQHRKGRQDKLRAKVFSKLSKEITIAAKMGEPDPDKNQRLRLAVKEAKGQSMPKDNIERAIKKAVGGEGEDGGRGAGRAGAAVDACCAKAAGAAEASRRARPTARRRVRIMDADFRTLERERRDSPPHRVDRQAVRPIGLRKSRSPGPRRQAPGATSSSSTEKRRVELGGS